MNRKKRDPQLWQRLESYNFHDLPLTRPLVDRLEDETGHPEEVCYTLVEEYRRFMYLVASTDEPLSPSPIINMVWHMHLDDRKAYLEDFCPKTLGRTILPSDNLPPLQDDPAYDRTLDDYVQEFGLAKVQYWPDPDVSIVRVSNVIMSIVGVAAFALAMVFASVLFAVFGVLVIAILVLMHWQFASLPLHNPRPEARE